MYHRVSIRADICDLLFITKRQAAILSGFADTDVVLTCFRRRRSYHDHETGMSDRLQLQLNRQYIPMIPSTSMRRPEIQQCVGDYDGEFTRQEGLRHCHQQSAVPDSSGSLNEDRSGPLINGDYSPLPFLSVAARNTAESGVGQHKGDHD